MIYQSDNLSTYTLSYFETSLFPLKIFSNGSNSEYRVKIKTGIFYFVPKTC